MSNRTRGDFQRVASPQPQGYYERVLPPRRFARGSLSGTEAKVVPPPQPRTRSTWMDLPEDTALESGSAEWREERSWTGTIAQISSLAPQPVARRIDRATIHAVPSRQSSWLGRLMILASLGVLASATTVSAVRMWHHPVRVPAPAAVASIGADRLELAPNRRSIVRVGAAGPRWTSIQPAAVDTMEITGSLVLGRTSTTLVGVDLDRGDTRFAFELPAGERWSQARPTIVGACFAALTVHGSDAMLHCIDPASGAPKWTAKIAGGHECTGQPVAVSGAYTVQCPGWTSVIDDRNGNVVVEAGGLAVIQQDPPMLLRTRDDGHLMLTPYSAKDRRFAARGTVLRATLEAPTSAVERNGRLIVRASSASEVIATIPQKAGVATTVSVPELQLADDAPFVSDCDLGGAPRFQLVELAPRATSTFDPELARQRVLALIDTDSGHVTWTSKRIVPAQTVPATFCKYGHYFVALGSRVWVVDATTGQTRAALGFAPGSDGSFADLTPEQIGTDVLVGITAAMPFAASWREAGAKLPAGLQDATVELEREIGQLP
jgi:hypothetical protein